MFVDGVGSSSALRQAVLVAFRIIKVLLPTALCLTSIKGIAELLLHVFNFASTTPLQISPTVTC